MKRKLNLRFVRMDYAALDKYEQVKIQEQENQRYYDGLPRFWNYNREGELAYETYEDFANRKPTNRPKPSKVRRSKFKTRKGGRR